MKAIELLKTTTTVETTRYKHLKACYDLATEMLDGIDIDDDVKAKMLNSVLLHDIGYSDIVKNTGHHSIDGYNFLKDNYPDLSYHKAILLHSDYISICPSEYSNYVSEVYDSLTDLEFATLLLVDYCDTHIDGYGNEVTIAGRCQDIATRYKGNLEVLADFDIVAQHSYHVESIINNVLDMLPKLKM